MSKKNPDRMSEVGSAILGGVIGSALGAMFSDKKENTIAAGLIGAALTASFKATNRAKSHNQKLIYAREDQLVEIDPDGHEKIIKNFESTSNLHLSKTFKLD